MKDVCVDVLILLSLLFSQLGLVFASPHSRVMDYINACKIDDWTTNCVPSAPGRKPLPWCPDQKDRISALMRSMQKHSPYSMRVVASTCFGSNVQLYYMPKRDEFMINPSIQSTNKETRWYECRGIRRPFHTEIQIKYLNSYFVEQTSTFYNVDALALECELE
jgi:hypothetical protein